MKLEWKSYAVLSVIFVATLTTKLILPLGPVWQELLSATVVLSPLGAIVRLVLDSLNHERQLHLQRDQQAFDLAASSHMASVVFDHYVAFCEAYLQVLDGIMSTLGKAHANGSLVNSTVQLADVRREHAMWIPVGLMQQLLDAERQLQVADEQLQIWARESHDDEELSPNVWMTLFEGVLEVVKDEEVKKARRSAQSYAAFMRRRVRALLKVEDLHALREQVFTQSQRWLQSHS